MKIIYFLACVGLLHAAPSQKEDPPAKPTNQLYSPPGPAEPPPAPWLTGSLIAPPGTAVSYGHILLENYVYCTTNTGAYNRNWQTIDAPYNFFSLNPQFLYFFGLTPWMDITIQPQFFYQLTNHQHSWEFGDLPIGFDFQLLDAAATPYFPGIKFTIREIFPTGNFKNLNPAKLGTDLSGAGAFGSSFSLVLYKLYQIGENYWMSNTITATYTVNSPANVSGLNAYGGGVGTSGKAMPGNSFQGIISFEWTLSQNWVFALDSVYQHNDATQFYGSTQSSMGLPSSEQVSFAPAIEYNFSSNIGIIAGCWFTAWGRNSAQFRSGVIEAVISY